IGPKPIDINNPAFEQTKKDVEERIQTFLAMKGTKTVDEYHRELGHIMWEYCGMARSADGLKKAKGLIQALKVDFWKNAIVLGENEELNQSLEKAGRVADFIELGELMVDDALMRNESCGGHFRIESQTPEGEALRDDENFAFVSAWEYQGENQPEILNKEMLDFEFVHLTQRSYK
ncbi:MAG: fumarate reductase/succinate dehydrogenase flavoprotein subunit, partial [Mucilaginibacter sp.]